MLLNYWHKFIDILHGTLSRTSDDAFIRAWKSRTARTEFYVGELLQNMAPQLGMTLRTELLSVDYAFCKTTASGERVPLIFVESENATATAEHEIRKLCALAAPLKILITCCEWSDERGVWKHGGKKSKHLASWSRIIKAYGEVWPNSCLYGIVVAEWSSALRYYTLCLDSHGDLCEDNGVSFQREIDWV